MIVDLEKRTEHYEMLKDACGHHVEFFDEYRLRLNETDSSDMECVRALLEWVNLAIEERGKDDIQLKQRLRMVALSLRFEQADEEILKNFVTWSDLEVFSSDQFFAGVIPDSRFGCYVSPESSRRWRIMMTFGWRQLVSDVLIVFSECVHGRCKLKSPQLHVEQNIDRALRGEHVMPYDGAEEKHVYETELLAMLFRMFVFAHEIGHVILRKEGKSYFRQRNEEIAADEIATHTYLSAALMVVQPFRDYLATKTIRSAEDRRALVAADPAFSELKRLGIESMINNPEAHAAIIKTSTLFRNEQHYRQSAYEHVLVYLVPCLVFKLIGRINSRLSWWDRIPLLQTHPSARVRNRNFWRTFEREDPNLRMLETVNHHFGRGMMAVFGG